ncbi:MAG: hypothetical protein GEV07_22300 [Streptosporangiales bacterium]|nr:hypothetical protein [Streptosporangiales bacterium]
MSWQWRYEDETGAVTKLGDGSDVVERFPSQSDAETWLGENWRDLLEQGVQQVTLLEDGREVYGPMSLQA